MCNWLTALERCGIQRGEKEAEENEAEHCSLLKICAQQTDKKVTLVNIENIFEVQQPVFKVLISDELMSALSSPVLGAGSTAMLEHEK